MLVQLAKRQVKAGSIIATQTCNWIALSKGSVQFLKHQMGVTQPENFTKFGMVFGDFQLGICWEGPTHFYKKSHADSLYRL